MPRHKDLKRLVRARMRKTGEAYTAARARILNKPIRKRTAAPVTRSAGSATATVVGPNEYAAIAGMSDAAIKASTGCTWERWVKALDYHGAGEMSHSDIAKLVKNKYKTNSWWTQTVAVGYERIKGLRVRGQQRDGTYGATKSRTYNVPVTTLFEAWADERVRRRWVDGVKVRVRTSTAPKSIRLDWGDRGLVAVGFTAKGKSKSAVALEHTNLPDRDTATQTKAYWSERLDALAAVLAEGAVPTVEP